MRNKTKEPVLLDAVEALEQSKRQSVVVAEEKRKATLLIKQEAEQKKRERHQKYYDELFQRVQQRITWAIETGECATTIVLTNDHYAWPAEFFEKDEYAEDVRRVVKYLQQRGYVAEVERLDTEQDETAAYMNSGGECGHSEIYWTRDIVLTISWKKS